MANGRRGRPKGYPKTGGRIKGTVNKETVVRQDSLKAALAIAFSELGPEAIDKLSPAELLRTAMRVAAKAGLGPEAIAIAKDAAPYFNAKLAPCDGNTNNDKTFIAIRGGFTKADDDRD